MFFFFKNLCGNQVSWTDGNLKRYAWITPIADHSVDLVSRDASLQLSLGGIYFFSIFCRIGGQLTTFFHQRFLFGSLGFFGWISEWGFAESVFLMLVGGFFRLCESGWRGCIVVYSLISTWFLSSVCFDPKFLVFGLHLRIKFGWKSLNVTTHKFFFGSKITPAGFEIVEFKHNFLASFSPSHFHHRFHFSAWTGFFPYIFSIA